MSVDPLADKFAGFSPYNYVLNNPIRLVDPDGRAPQDWIIKFSAMKNGVINVDITFKAAVLNSSGSSAFSAASVSSAVKSQLENSYTGKFDGKISQLSGIGNVGLSDVTYNVNTTVDIRMIGSAADLADDEHLINVKSKSSMAGVYGKVNKIGGKEVMLNEKYIPGMLSGADNNTIPHEVGHTAGLYHPNNAEGFLLGIKKWFEGQRFSPGSSGEDKHNMMYSGDSGLLNDKTSIDINSKQMQVIINNIRNGNVNKD